MKTSELIELADYCANTYCGVCRHYKVNCWGTFDLIEKLRNRLEKAYDDLQLEECVTCKWAEECNQHDCDRGCNWVWKGDEE